MQIYDKLHEAHEVTVGETIEIDGKVLSRVQRNHNTVLIHGYHVPPHLQGRGIGSALLHALERTFSQSHATQLRIIIPYDDCPIYAGFFNKHGYKQDQNVWVKNIIQ
jgi:GNAT superfamily N-acetyltransferase